MKRLLITVGAVIPADSLPLDAKATDRPGCPTRRCSHSGPRLRSPHERSPEEEG